MLSTIASASTNIYQNYRDLQIASNSTSQALSFDELLSNDIIKTKEEPLLGVEKINALPSTQTISETEQNLSGSSNDEMDLNKDGQVTSDEIIKYVQMQVMDRMVEELSSDDGLNLMGQQPHNQTNIQDFKNKIAKTAYNIGEKLIDTTTSAISYSFLI